MAEEENPVRLCDQEEDYPPVMEGTEEVFGCKRWYMESVNFMEERAEEIQKWREMRKPEFWDFRENDEKDGDFYPRMTLNRNVPMIPSNSGCQSQRDGNGHGKCEVAFQIGEMNLQFMKLNDHLANEWGLGGCRVEAQVKVEMVQDLERKLVTEKQEKNEALEQLEGAKAQLFLKEKEVEALKGQIRHLIENYTVLQTQAQMQFEENWTSSAAFLEEKQKLKQAIRNLSEEKRQAIDKLEKQIQELSLELSHTLEEKVRVDGVATSFQEEIWRISSENKKLEELMDETLSKWEEEKKGIVGQSQMLIETLRTEIGKQEMEIAVEKVTAEQALKNLEELQQLYRALSNDLDELNAKKLQDVERIKELEEEMEKTLQHHSENKDMSSAKLRKLREQNNQLRYYYNKLKEENQRYQNRLNNL